MSIGLDIGVHRMRSLRYSGGRLLGRGCRSLYSVLPDTGLHRGLLRQVQIPFGTCENHLVVLGDAAAEISGSLDVRSRLLLPHGRVPRNDSLVRQVLVSLLDALLPEPQQPGEICCLNLPGIRDRGRRRMPRGVELSPATSGRTEAVDWTTKNRYRTGSSKRDATCEFLTHLAHLRGYRPILLSSGMAVVLAELGNESFTGLGVTFGAASTELSLAHHSVEIAGCSIPFGGHGVDEQLAQEDPDHSPDASEKQPVDIQPVIDWKETLSSPLLQPVNQRESRLSKLYRELVEMVLKEAARELAWTPAVRNVSGPMSLVASGGVARIPGFEDLLRRTVRKIPFPVEIGDVRVASESDYTVARGCLIQAELETETESLKPTAA